MITSTLAYCDNHTIIAKLRFDINFEISLSLRLAIYTALQRKGGRRRGVEDLYKNSSNSSNLKMTLIQFMHGNLLYLLKLDHMQMLNVFYQLFWYHSLLTKINSCVNHFKNSSSLMLNAYCNNILLLLYIHVTTVIVRGLRLQQLESLLCKIVLSVLHAINTLSITTLLCIKYCNTECIYCAEERIRLLQSQPVHNNCCHTQQQLLLQAFNVQSIQLYYKNACLHWYRKEMH